MTTVTVTKLEGGIAQVELSRPAKGNAMNLEFWVEYREAFHRLALDSDVRAIVVTGQGKFFSAGLDVTDDRILNLGEGDDVARKAFYTRRLIQTMQETFTSMERCPQPVIACVHSACIGGAMDLITAADIRFCTKDAFFSIKEVDIGLAADVGTLQRIQHVVGSSSLVRDWAFTGRRFESAEAVSSGLCSRVFESREEMLAEGLAMAKLIATKSPVAIAGIKQNLNYSRGRTVNDTLEYMSIWNASMVQTDDVPKAALSSLQKKPQPDFNRL